MDYWDQPLTFMITPKSGPLPQMSSLIDANRALTGNLPNGFLKRPHWLRAGQALVSAAETGKAADIEVAFESIVIALDEEGWLAREIPSAPPLSASSSDLGMRDMGDIEWRKRSYRHVRHATDFGKPNRHLCHGRHESSGPAI
jgi:hypothetical protein